MDAFFDGVHTKKEKVTKEEVKWTEIASNENVGPQFFKSYEVDGEIWIDMQKLFFYKLHKATKWRPHPTIQQITDGLLRYAKFLRDLYGISGDFKFSHIGFDSNSDLFFIDHDGRKRQTDSAKDDLPRDLKKVIVQQFAVLYVGNGFEATWDQFKYALTFEQIVDTIYNWIQRMNRKYS